MQAQMAPPTLADFWEGRAEWRLDIVDVGLPMGESDTLVLPDGRYHSYLHASYQSAGIRDSCGDDVPFPGCITLWESRDNGQSFALTQPQCLIPCGQCPCDDVRDHTPVQQYPRVALSEDLYYMTYEWRAQVMIRTSLDGLVWSDWAYLVTPGGTWPSSYAPCTPVEKIGAHPNIRGEIHDCLVGGPPGIYLEGDTVYLFVMAGSAPSNMRCYKNYRYARPDEFELCQTDPLFTGALTYGDVAVLGEAAEPYFDFRYVSSAEVLKVGDRYYMAYEGIRGPEELEIGMDTQFGLGFARSVTDQIDGAWEKYPGNPILDGMIFNPGIGHADLLVIDGTTIMYTATSETTRGRYVLAWK